MLSTIPLAKDPHGFTLESLIRDNQLESIVSLRGAVGETDVRNNLENSHVFVLGSYDEAIGVATMEAMAMGLPVVVTNVGGVPELVRADIDGLLVQPGQPQHMADAIVRVLIRSGDRRAAGDGRTCSVCSAVRASFSSRRQKSAETLLPAGLTLSAG